MGEHFEKVMIEMCNRVGVGWDKIDPKKPEWYMEHPWSEKVQKSFSDWMVDYLYNSSEARKEIMQYPAKNKKRIEALVSMFLFNYGWRIIK